MPEYWACDLPDINELVEEINREEEYFLHPNRNPHNNL